MGGHLAATKSTAADGGRELGHKMTTRARSLKDTQLAVVWESLCAQWSLWLALAVLTVLVVLLNLRALAALSDRWEVDPNYGHGALIPFIALYFAFVHRDRLVGNIPRRNYGGLVVLLVGMAMKYIAMPLASVIMEGIAMVVMVNGLVLYVGGWQVYRVLWVPALYLFFMIPLPSFVHTAVAFPLQLFASKVSAGLLKYFLGVNVILDGNVLTLANRQLSVEEACSGMRSLLGLVALGVAFAYLVKRPLWERVVLVLSTIPIAIVANVFRVTVTALLHEWGYSRIAEGAYHTLTGWFVFLFALAVFLGLNWLLGKLWVEVPEKRDIKT